MNQQETILCAALWLDDGEAHVFQPTATGGVIGGHRHHNCLNTAADLGVTGKKWRKRQGFLTSHNRFVNRSEAYVVAFNAGQLPRGEHVHGRDLYSEDLW